MQVQRYGAPVHQPQAPVYQAQAPQYQSAPAGGQHQYYSQPPPPQYAQPQAQWAGQGQAAQQPGDAQAQQWGELEL